MLLLVFSVVLTRQSHSFPPSVSNPNDRTQSYKTHYTFQHTYISLHKKLCSTSFQFFRISPSTSKWYVHWFTIYVSIQQFRFGSRASSSPGYKRLWTFDRPRSLARQQILRYVVVIGENKCLAGRYNGREKDGTGRLGARLRGIYRTDHRRGKKVGINGGRVQLRK